MRVLITPQFNASMLNLGKNAQQEISQLFALASSMSLEQLIDLPIFTKLESGNGDMYTLRTRSTRVFCTFDSADDLLFLDAKEVRYPSIEAPTPQDSEITLFGPKGDPKAYIATDEENTIYSFDGRPLAYLDQDNIYGFNGHHLGWFEDGIVWDHKGLRTGFTSSTCPAFTKFEPFKGFKRFKPFKNFKRFAPFKPFKSLSQSKTDMLALSDVNEEIKNEVEEVLLQALSVAREINGVIDDVDGAKSLRLSGDLIDMLRRALSPRTGISIFRSS